MRAGVDSSFTSSIGTQPGRETAAGTAPPPHCETHRRARSNTFYNKIVDAVTRSLIPLIAIFIDLCFTAFFL